MNDQQINDLAELMAEMTHILHRRVDMMPLGGSVTDAGNTTVIRRAQMKLVREFPAIGSMLNGLIHRVPEDQRALFIDRFNRLATRVQQLQMPH